MERLRAKNRDAGRGVRSLLNCFSKKKFAFDPLQAPGSREASTEVVSLIAWRDAVQW
jgi:hypothetical protein